MPLPPHHNPIQAAEQRQTVRSGRMGKELRNVVHRFETCDRIHSDERIARNGVYIQRWSIRRNDCGSRITRVCQRYITLPEYVTVRQFGNGNRLSRENRLVQILSTSFFFFFLIQEIMSTNFSILSVKQSRRGDQGLIDASAVPFGYKLKVRMLDLGLDSCI